MKINYDTSDLITLGMTEDEQNSFARLFCCKVGQFPFKYLEVPLHYAKLRREDIQPVVDKILK